MKRKNKIIKNLKVYFLIVNLIISIIAFNVLISGQITGKDIEVGDSGTVISDSGTSGTNTGGVNLDSTEGGVISIGDGTIIGTGTNTGTGTGTGTPPGTSTPPGTGVPPGTATPPGTDSVTGVVSKLNLQSIITKGTIGASIFGAIGTLAGGDNGQLYGAIAGGIGGVFAAIIQPAVGEFWSSVLGLGLAAIIFAATYKKASKETVEFNCLPWQAPVGGDDCTLCNKFAECSEYTCKSLGQACGILNSGTKEQRCVWLNPQDVSSPTIEMKKVNKEHKFAPDKSVRPPATGVVIAKADGKCIKAFTPLEFTFVTNEPAQCKIDYSLTASTKEKPRAGFEEMSFYVGGDSLFVNNHTEKLALPGPDAVNAVAPELKNDGTYTLYIRCQDGNGNFNQDAYSVTFCVEKGPDTTPPVIVDVNIPSEKPVQFNQTNFALEVYVNEPSECRWSREDRDYENMENKMSCNTNLWEMNNKNVYTCKATLTGIEDRKENIYYFRCKDQPWAQESDRNVNIQSYQYKLIGTQPLNIMEVKPANETISGATDTIEVSLEIKTDNGYKDGEASCYYSNTKPSGDGDYIKFLETGGNAHKQRQDLVTGDYKYYFKCVDLGGNTAYSSVQFKVISDRKQPIIVRVYKEGSELKVITNENAECSYSNINCNFNVDDGIKMLSLNYLIHNAEWTINKNYYIRCKDKYNNQPNPNICSIIVKPFKSDKKEKTDSFEF